MGILNGEPEAAAKNGPTYKTGAMRKTRVQQGGNPKMTIGMKNTFLALAPATARFVSSLARATASAPAPVEIPSSRGPPRGLNR